MEEIKEAELRSRRGKLIYNRTYNPVGSNKVNHFSRLCIKVGRGQGDGDMVTRVWELGIWGRKTRDLGTSSMGCE